MVVVPCTTSADSSVVLEICVSAPRGFISDWELKQAMGTLGFNLTDEEVAAMLLEALHFR